MFLKKCPFCDSEPVILSGDIYTLYCSTCKNNGIDLSIKNSSLEKIQELWNSRITLLDANEVGKTNYGYLITKSSDVIKCNNPHPEEIFNYLGIYDNFDDYDYIEICHKLNILRICEHCNCVSIDIPYEPSKEQISKAITLIKNYLNYINFDIFIAEKQKMIHINNANDCIAELDKIK